MRECREENIDKGKGGQISLVSAMHTASDGNYDFLWLMGEFEASVDGRFPMIKQIFQYTVSG